MRGGACSPPRCPCRWLLHADDASQPCVHGEGETPCTAARRCVCMTQNPDTGCCDGPPASTFAGSCEHGDAPWLRSGTGVVRMGASSYGSHETGQSLMLAGMRMGVAPRTGKGAGWLVNDRMTMGETLPLQGARMNATASMQVRLARLGSLVRARMGQRCRPGESMDEIVGVCRYCGKQLTLWDIGDSCMQENGEVLYWCYPCTYEEGSE